VPWSIGFWNGTLLGWVANGDCARESVVPALEAAPVVPELGDPGSEPVVLMGRPFAERAAPALRRACAAVAEPLGGLVCVLF